MLDEYLVYKVAELCWSEVDHEKWDIEAESCAAAWDLSDGRDSDLVWTTSTIPAGQLQS
jgi:hypothetical protein